MIPDLNSFVEGGREGGSGTRKIQSGSYARAGGGRKMRDIKLFTIKNQN